MQSAPRVNGGLQTELRVARQHEIDGAAPEWLIFPWGAAQFVWPGTRAELRYSPRVGLRYQRSQPSPVDAELLHALSGEVRFRSPRALESWAKVGLELGRVEVGPLRLPESIGGAAATMAPSVSGDVEYVNASGLLGLSGRMDRRTSWSSAIGYRFSGDLRDPGGPTSSTPLPLQHRPEWTTSVDHALTRRDALLARASASGVFVHQGWILQAHATGGWRRNLSRRLLLEAGLGLGGQSRADPQRLVPVPVGNLAISYEGPPRARVSARAEFGAVPFVDPFTGNSYTRSDASLGGSWSPTRAVRLHLLVAVGAPLGREALRYYATAYADCGATILLPRGASLAAGVQWAAQRLILGADRPRTDWGAFVRFSYGTK